MMESLDKEKRRKLKKIFLMNYLNGE